MSEREKGGHRANSFVGREVETRDLLAALEAACSGRGGLVFISGEPGIGKTRLAEELAERSAERGVESLWGHCQEGEGTPPYWPWTQILRGYLEGRDVQALPRGLRSDARELTAIVPELQTPDGESGGDFLPTEPEHRRLRFFESFASFLRVAGRRSPLVLILDDLQWADRSSLRLLRYVTGELRRASILVVGCHREVDRRPAPFADFLASLAPEAHRVELRGLSEDEVVHFARRAGGESLSREAAHQIHQMTRGNPFFVSEMLHSLRTPGAGSAPHPKRVVPIPEGVREAVRRRIAGLSPRCRELLEIASVVGREFSVPVLAAATSRPTSDVLATIEEARATATVSEHSPVLGRYAFSHDIVREALYDEIPPSRRSEHHRLVGEALERFGGSELCSAAELAAHFRAAILTGGAPKAIVHSRRAANDALHSFAYEEAASHLENALAVAPLAGVSTEEECDLRLRLGEALWSSGAFEAARRAFREAATLASRIGAQDHLARAALGYGGPVAAFESGGVDADLVGLLEDALAALPGEDSPLRARLLGRLAASLTFSREEQRRTGFAREAIAMARRIGDERALADVLNTAHWALWNPDNAEERLRISTEVIHLAENTDDGRLATDGLDWRLAHLLELGRTSEIDFAFDAHQRIANKLRTSYGRWQAAVARAMRALLEGRLETVESIAQEALRIGQETQNRNATILFGAQILFLRAEQDRLDQLAPFVATLAEQYPAIPAWRCGLAWVHAELGRTEEARTELERFASRNFEDLPRDMLWLAGLWALAEVAAALEDRHRAAQLYGLLLPYAERTMVIATAVCAGSMERTLGILATVLGRFPEAERHFLRAIELNRTLRAAPWVARAQLDLAKTRRHRRAPGDPEQSRALATEALGTARALGMVALEKRASFLVAGLDGQAPAEVAPNKPSDLLEATFWRQEEFWLLTYRGTTVRLRDTNGLRYIGALLRTPGQPVHVSDLMKERKAPTRPSTRGHTTERHRTSVTKAIRWALAKITEAHPELGAHLRSAVRTGTTCAYAPRTERNLRWNL